MISESQLEKYPRTAHVLGYVQERYLLYGRSYAHIMREFDDGYLRFSEDFLMATAPLFTAAGALDAALDAFIAFSHEFLLLQAELVKTGRYRHSTFDAINAEVYQNREKMEERYLVGLLLSQVLWPNHYRIARYFISQAGLTDTGSRILDVPVGEGVYAYLIHRFFPFKSLSALDVSPHSVAFSRRFLRGMGVGPDRVLVDERDVFSADAAERYDLVVCGELLEHVERPGELLEKLRSLVAPGGSVFLTTAIYAAAEDHIYLFNNADEVRMLLKRFFRIRSELILPLSLQPFAEGLKKEAMNYACVLEPVPGGSAA